MYDNFLLKWQETRQRLELKAEDRINERKPASSKKV